MTGSKVLPSLKGCWARVIQAQVEGQTAKQKEALYKAALQDLTLFKSRTSAALLQVSKLPLS